ncbi:Integral membrane protein OS=Tsukamurella paurometabola (strain ATCC 8368 / DSM / CCUG 35730/ CIP 100753 / JCM 10117 / KCTC 9821 / NBRC 16120 / NCIMB 702349/ NCTC 13040) OX=521096 GN=Tpau_1550 PE=4 SV=1 [Tsukamurella paurometabola]|uniref:DUF6545 domain-containing protein n=1 Tax=Tsukamurella paurometabola (strain ATCC 8368 / DSM 20162 / CCUG 35730 / CIP 100753 / JCM 10117 / KCTC 9821 / NBRC 16120 / NCIMB 702349 / NCTC 13040) TaxID=521096 RepID=D5UY65_TSUPD|nr:MAB_1171c family putative transporter [Tsukamurella paurometabola]ADG78172.1 conserved hypothetical protein [Tsukamurella paurometabola DSM 20162]SUP30530.1 Uncharacterised protein [Tsukamurella paurometabola]
MASAENVLAALGTPMYVVAAVMCWLGVALHVRRLLVGRRSTGAIAMLCAFVFKSVTFTLAVPAVYVFVDRVVELPNISRLILNVSGGVLWTGSTLIAFSFWEIGGSPRRASVWTYVTVAGVGAIAMTVLWANCRRVEVASAFPVGGALSPAIIGYLTMYILVLSIGLRQMLVNCTAGQQLPFRPNVRVGLRITAFGARTYLLFCAIRATSILLAVLGVNVSVLQLTTAPLTALAVSVMVIGLSAMAWTPVSGRVSERARRNREYRHLRRLWRDLCDVDDGIRLTPHGSVVGDRGFRLYRRAIEVQDGLMAMVPAELARALATCAASGDSGRAARELAAAIDERLRPSRPSTPPSEPVGLSLHAPSVADISWLAVVGREYRHLTSSGRMLSRIA